MNLSWLNTDEELVAGWLTAYAGPLPVQPPGGTLRQPAAVVDRRSGWWAWGVTRPTIDTTTLAGEIGHSRMVNLDLTVHAQIGGAPAAAWARHRMAEVLLAIPEESAIPDAWSLAGLSDDYATYADESGDTWFSYSIRLTYRVEE